MVDVEVYPNGGGMSVAVGLVLTPNPRYTHVMALDELDHPMKKRISAETWDQAQALKQAWLEHPSR